MSDLETTAVRDELSARLAYYRLFAAYFMELPTQETLDAFRSLADAYLEGGDAPEGAERLERFFSQQANASPEETLQAVAVDRTFLVRGTTKKGPKPPYGSLYAHKEAGHGSEVGQGMLAIKAAYRQAGLSVVEDMHESPDYLGVELSFAAELVDRMARQCADADDAELRAAESALAQFMDEHLYPFAHAYVQEGVRFAKTDFSCGVLLLMDEFLSEEQDALRK